MIQLWLSIGIAAHAAAASQPFPVQFGKEVVGRNVMICLDGGRVKSTFAGKLAFRDPSGSWGSVCADVRRPITTGQYFVVKPAKSNQVGGNVAKAGHIVARFFDRARTPDECAGLQLAVWEAIEDGGGAADFTSGHFQARATPGALGYATQFYSDGVYAPDEAVYLKTNGHRQGQSQLTPSPTS